MMEEILKRPLSRPLFWWITGILLEICIPLRRWSLVLLLPVVVAVFSCFLEKRKKPVLSYDARWVWGVPIACLFVFLAIQLTALSEQRLSYPLRTNRIEQQAKKIQQRLIDKLDRLQLSDTEKAVLATITVNHRHKMTWKIRSRFSTSGVAHLLSVSGFHVAIVCGFSALFFSFFPKRTFFRWLRYVLMMLLLWAFATVSGLSVPAVRAALMLSVFLTGQVLQRQPDKYNTLAAAALLMLVYNPFYLFDVGFQLSFLAVLFILYIQPRLYRLLEIRNPLIAVPWGVLTVTVAAQIGTFPLCCYYFGEISTVFLFANLFLSILSMLLIPVALVWLFLPSGVPGVDYFQLLPEWLMHGFMWLVNRFSEVPGASFSMRFDFMTMSGIYGVLFLSMYYFRSGRRGALFAALSVFLLVLCRQIIQRI